MSEPEPPAAAHNAESILLRNVFTNWTVLACNVAFVLIVTPVVIRALGVERYGVWSFVNGLLAYSELLYFGLGGALIKYVAQYRATGDRHRLNRTVSVVLSIYTVLGAICFTAMLALSDYAPKLFGEPLAPDTARVASSVCILLGVRLWLLFVGSAFAGLICGYDRFDRVNAVSLASLLVKFVLTPLVVPGAHEPLLSLTALMTGIAAFECVAIIGVALVTAKNLTLWPRRPTTDELRLLYGFGVQSFFILLAAKLISYTDTTVIGMVLGADSVAVYSLPLQLIEYGRLCVAGFAGVLLPRLTGAFAAGNMDVIREGFLRSSRVGSLLSAWLVGTIISLGVPFLNLWVGPEFGTGTQSVLTFLGIAAFFQVLTVQVPLPFYQSTQLMARPAGILMIEALANLVLSLLLASRFGISGVAFATLLPAVFVSFLYLIPYFCRRIDFSLRRYMLEAVLPGALLLILVIASQFGLRNLFDDDSVVTLALRFLATIPCAAVAFWVAVPVSERLAYLRATRQLLSAAGVVKSVEYPTGNP